MVAAALHCSRTDAHAKATYSLELLSLELALCARGLIVPRRLVAGAQPTAPSYLARATHIVRERISPDAIWPQQPSPTSACCWPLGSTQRTHRELAYQLIGCARAREPANTLLPAGTSCPGERQLADKRRLVSTCVSLSFRARKLSCRKSPSALARARAQV